MSSKECEEQLKSLVEAWDLDEACLNQTDIEAIKHLMLENQMQQDHINTLKNVLNDIVDRHQKVIEYINGENPDAGVSGKHIKDLLKGDK